MTNKIKIRFFHKAFRLGQERIVICFKEEPWEHPKVCVNLQTDVR